MSEKHEFGSREWLEGVRSILERLFEDARQQGEIDEAAEFAMCEVYTSVPPHISGDGRVAWHCRLKDGRLTVAFEETDEANIKVVADWETIQPLAKAEYDLTDASTLTPEIMGMMAEVQQGGKLQTTFNGDLNAPAAFMGAHNLIAAITK